MIRSYFFFCLSIYLFTYFAHDCNYLSDLRDWCLCCIFYLSFSEEGHSPYKCYVHLVYHEVSKRFKFSFFSVSALLMMVTLKKLASTGCTIIFTICQSSTEVFGLFDRICLLSNGNTLFFGETLACLQVMHRWVSSICRLHLVSLSTFLLESLWAHYMWHYCQIWTLNNG